MQNKFKLVSVFFILFLFVQFVFSMSGDGSVTSPFVITNCIELQSMKNNLSANYVLLNNIDCSSATRSGGALWNNGLGFTPIGNNSTPFTGTFDGKGYVINGIYISNSVGSYLGLFGKIQNSSVKRVGLTGVIISGNGFIGGITGMSTLSAVSDVYVTGQLSGKLYVGGLIGQQYSDSNLTKSYFSGILTGSNYLSYIGGLVGRNVGSLIQNSFASSRIALSIQSGLPNISTYAGGIAGGILGGVISNAYWFDPSNKIDKCYFSGNSGCIKASALSDFYPSTFAVYTGPLTWSSDVWVWSTNALPQLKPTYFCYGNILQNSEPYSGDDVGLTEADNRIAIFSETNTSKKCEYTCKSGFKKIGDKCIDFICNETGINQTNATLCKDDEINLTKDQNKSLVNFGACTNNKCEWECKQNYFVSQDKKSCLPFECSPKISNSIVCANDDFNLTQNINSVLVESDANCTLQTKCEYYCKPGSFKNGNKCTLWACDGNIDSNAIMYQGDGSNFSNKEELVNQLVDENTSRKCEWKCKNNFYRDGNECKPFVCVGTIDTNAVMCSGDNTNLDKNYPLLLLDSSLNCSSTKCEWYCRNGYYAKDGKCFPLSTLVCEGATILNSEICPDDDVFLPQKGIANLLVASKESCSDARKCQWYCKTGYYQGNGADSNKCIPSSCYGPIFENALLYFNDDVGLDLNTPRNLVTENTPAKCEYYCKQSYHVEIQNGVKICVPNIYSCMGKFDNATLFDLDEAGLDYNIASVLSKTNTLRKCEWYCNKNYVKIGDECVSTIKEESACGLANRDYLVGEIFPGDDSLCEVGTPSSSELTLNTIPGSIVSWKCSSEDIVSCKATRIPSPNSDNNFSSILELTTEALDDSNILIYIKCASNIKVNLNIVGYSTNENYDFSPTQIDCNKSLTEHKIILNSVPLGETELLVKTSIKNSASECYTCEMSSSVSILNNSKTTELDPTVIVILIGIVLVIGVLFNILFNSSEEDEEIN